jgi:hypothetical protein
MIGTDIILGIDCTASNFWNPITSEYKVEKYRPAHMEEYHIEEKSLDFKPNLMKLGLLYCLRQKDSVRHSYE